MIINRNVSIRIFICLMISREASCSFGDRIRKISRIVSSVLNPSVIYPEDSMTLKEIIQYHGYPIEIYNITTKDGYILTVQRIPHGNKNSTFVQRIPVLILPGLSASSGVWVLNTPEKNLPYILAEKGYDVWLGNFRGTRFGRRHISLSPKYKKFWKFGLDEMAIYDLPAMIDFVLEKSGFDQLHCIGHSLGTTIPFATLSTKVEYNKKIRSLHAFGPAARLDHIKSPLFVFAKDYIAFFTYMHNVVGNIKIFDHHIITEYLFLIACEWAPNLLCIMNYFIMDNVDSEQLNLERLPLFVHFHPDGSSSQAFLQYIQISAYHRFQWYDYGKKENMIKYNQAIPPEYDISKITTPVALYWGENDGFAAPEDVAYLVENLKNVVLNYRVPHKKFNHEDFVLAKDNVRLLYNKLCDIMEQL